MKARPGLELSAVRVAAGLTQAKAAGLLFVDLRTWRRREADDRAMHPAFFELFWLKTKKRRLGAGVEV